MALVGVLHMRVDTSLKDVLEFLRFSVLAVEQTSEVNVKEGGAVELGINVEVHRNTHPGTRLTCVPDRKGLCRCKPVSPISAVQLIL
jgi:hypothetical protein